MKIFDYLFYRMYDYYHRNEKIPSALLTASGYLSFLQFLMIYCVLMLYAIIFDKKFDVIEWLRRDKALGKVLVLSVFLSLEVYNYLRYRKKERQEVLQKRFYRHPLNKVIKPWMFLLLGALLFSLPIFVDYLIKS